MRTLCSGLFAFVFVCSSAGLRADDQDEARKVLDRAIKAAGGAEKLAALKAMTWKSTGNYYGMGAAIPYSGSYAMQYPARFRMEIENVFTLVFDQDKGWIGSQNGTVEMTKDQIDEQREVQYTNWVTTLAPLAKSGKDFKLSLIGESKIDNRDAVGITVSKKDHRDVKLHFDKENGLLLKAEFIVKSPELDNKEVLEETVYSGYEDLKGIRIARKATIKRDGKLFVEAENTEVAHPEKIEASVFAKP
jgi:hypothetical protein